MTQPTPYRVIPLIGRDDSGKTWLARAMAAAANAAPRAVVVDGRHAVVVDIPGHAQMTQLVDFADHATEQWLLASSGAAGAILVISATDSVLPETRRSATTALALGIPIVAAALTKCDQVEDVEMLALLTMEIRELLTKFHAANVPVLQTSAGPETTRGMQSLLSVLAH